jgi:hypothetical protein
MLTSFDHQTGGPVICDACGAQMRFVGSVLCRYCFDTAFCSDCHALIIEDKMPLNICASNHDWIVLTEPSRSAAKGNFLVEGKEVSFEEFLQSLKKSWNI